MNKLELLASYRRLCRLLMEERKKAGFGQTEIAQRLGRSQSYVSKAELGNRVLNVLEFVEFARAVGADPIPLLHQSFGAISLERDMRERSSAAEKRDQVLHDRPPELETFDVVERSHESGEEASTDLID